jgi:AcrR family transcriptional regulator
VCFRDHYLSDTSKRSTLIQTARKLIYRQGYHQKTLADIAEKSGISVGNIYYYFKTREQMIQAIIDERTQRFVALTEEWEKEPDPRKRLLLFLEITTTINRNIAEKGVPGGKLVAGTQQIRRDRFKDRKYHHPGTSGLGNRTVSLDRQGKPTGTCL